MKKYYLAILLILSLQKANSQISLNFTFKQSPALIVSAGDDTTVRKGDKVQLHGTAVDGSGSYIYSWTPISGLDQTDILNPIATVDTTIIYTLSVKDPAGCIKTAQVKFTVDHITAIDPITLELGLRIFPNPNKGRFYITTEKVLEERSLLLEIFNPVGSKIYTETIYGNQRLQKVINFPAAIMGLYVIRLTGKKINLTQKISVL